MRAIFYGNSNNSFFLFALYLSDDPVLYLKVQPIVRFSPHGSPLIIVSVLDYQLALLLMASKANWIRRSVTPTFIVFSRRASRDKSVTFEHHQLKKWICLYVHRVNSTRMRRSVWESKNLPRGEKNPWMATFLSPLYTENTFSDCTKISNNVYRFLHRKETSPRDITGDSATFILSASKFSSLFQCSACSIKKINLNKCSPLHL